VSAHDRLAQKLGGPADCAEELDQKEQFPYATRAGRDMIPAITTTRHEEDDGHGRLCRPAQGAGFAGAAFKRCETREIWVSACPILHRDLSVVRPSKNCDILGSRVFDSCEIICIRPAPASPFRHQSKARVTIHLGTDHRHRDRLPADKSWARRQHSTRLLTVSAPTARARRRCQCGDRDGRAKDQCKTQMIAGLQARVPGAISWDSRFPRQGPAGETMSMKDICWSSTTRSRPH